MPDCSCEEWWITNRTLPISSVVDDALAFGVQKCALQWLTDPDVGHDPVNLILSTGGGSLTAGLAIMDTIAWLQDEGVQVRGIVHGSTASMGVFLLEQCSVRLMSRRGYLLLHGLTAQLHADMHGQAIEAQWNKHITAQLTSLLVERTGQPRAEWSKMLASNYLQIYSGQEALEAGLVDGFASEGAVRLDLSPYKARLPMPRRGRKE